MLCVCVFVSVCVDSCMKRAHMQRDSYITVCAHDWMHTRSREYSLNQPHTRTHVHARTQINILWRAANDLA